MLESEMRKKWCPFARMVAGMPSGSEEVALAPGFPAGYNRVALGTRKEFSRPPATQCIGSECAAWVTFAPGENNEREGDCGLKQEIRR